MKISDIRFDALNFMSLTKSSGYKNSSHMIRYIRRRDYKICVKDILINLDEYVRLGIIDYEEELLNELHKVIQDKKSMNDLIKSLSEKIYNEKSKYLYWHVSGWRKNGVMTDVYGLSVFFNDFYPEHFDVNTNCIDYNNENLFINGKQTHLAKQLDITQDEYEGKISGLKNKTPDKMKDCLKYFQNQGYILVYLNSDSIEEIPIIQKYGLEKYKMLISNS